MTILKALKRIDSLSKSELEHFIQLLEIDIKNYERSCKHYPPDKALKYGKPYMDRLVERRQLFINKLKQL